jgi:hypothetical protein
LDRLEDGAEMTKPGTEDAATHVRIGLDGIYVRVELEEEVPKEETGVAGDDPHLNKTEVKNMYGVMTSLSLTKK